jgi:hypothetical protein
LEYSKNTEYGKTKCFRCLLSPDRKEAAIFFGMNKIMSRALDRDGTQIYPCKVLNRFACPYDKKSNNYTMDGDFTESQTQPIVQAPNAKNFEQLFKQRPGQSPATVSLSIFEEGSSEKPRQITDPEKFKSTPFDDLWNEATTLKVKLDRSIKDQLDERQYG